jgi:type I restriction enzyme S subunit
VVRWSELDAWDIKAATAAVLRARRGTFRPFGDFIEERSQLVRPSLDPERMWPVYGVSNQTGAFLSHRQRGAEFGTPYKHIEHGWFFHNPTRANVGSFARVPEVEAEALTSPEYQVWEITDPDWSADFVEILLQLPLFVEQVQVYRVGAVKQRLYVENLRRIPVPVLSPEEQRRVVQTWRASAAEEARLRSEADARTREAADALLSELALTAPGDISRTKAFAVRWSDMERWAVAASRAATGGRLEDGRYPLVPLGDLVADLENGWSPKCLPRPAEPGEWGVLKVGAVSAGRYDPRENKALPAALEPQPRLEVRPGDFLIGRANVTRLVGACALVHETPLQLMLSDKIFRARWRDDGPVDPAYLDAVLKLPHLRAIMEAAATGSSPTMKNIAKPALMGLPIPCPPLQEQRRLAALVGSHRDSAAALLAAADKARHDRLEAAQQQVLTMAGDDA